MSLINTVLQGFVELRALQQTDKLLQAGHRAAERGRRIAFASLFIMVAFLFFFSAILVFVIDLGLQFDRAHAVGFSGLMVSSFILIGLGLFCLMISWLSGRGGPSPYVAAERAQASPLRGLAEEAMAMFLRELIAKKGAAGSDPRPHVPANETAPSAPPFEPPA